MYILAKNLNEPNGFKVGEIEFRIGEHDDLVLRTNRKTGEKFIGCKNWMKHKKTYNIDNFKIYDKNVLAKLECLGYEIEGKGYISCNDPIFVEEEIKSYIKYGQEIISFSRIGLDLDVRVKDYYDDNQMFKRFRIQTCLAPETFNHLIGYHLDEKEII